MVQRGSAESPRRGDKLEGSMISAAVKCRRAQLSRGWFWLHARCLLPTVAGQLLLPGLPRYDRCTGPIAPPARGGIAAESDTLDRPVDERSTGRRRRRAQ